VTFPCWSYWRSFYVSVRKSNEDERQALFTLRLPGMRENGWQPLHPLCLPPLWKDGWHPLHTLRLSLLFKDEWALLELFLPYVRANGIVVFVRQNVWFDILNASFITKLLLFELLRS
jgi:hypothetical protein